MEELKACRCKLALLAAAPSLGARGIQPPGALILMGPGPSMGPGTSMGPELRVALGPGRAVNKAPLAPPEPGGLLREWAIQSSFATPCAGSHSGHVAPAVQCRLAVSIRMLLAPDTTCHCIHAASVVQCHVNIVKSSRSVLRLQQAHGQYKRHSQPPPWPQRCLCPPWPMLHSPYAWP